MSSSKVWQNEKEGNVSVEEIFGKYENLFVCVSKQLTCSDMFCSFLQ